MRRLKFEIKSEVGKLEGIVLHRPGKEVSNMTPSNAKKALYSDILNLNILTEEYNEFYDVLNKVSTTYDVKDLLEDVLGNDKIKLDLINRVCDNEKVPQLKDFLYNKINTEELTRMLIEGVPLKRNDLTNFLSPDKYILQPLHNLFFMRDSAVVYNNSTYISNMANVVRDRESMIMESIFDYHINFNTKTINPINSKYHKHGLSTEGGDILIAREDIILIGNGCRTNTTGIDFILKTIKDKKEKCHIIVQELPSFPESFIHLDMVFTLLDYDKCMIYEPVIYDEKLYTIHIEIDNGKVNIRYRKNILDALKGLGIDLSPLKCGGTADIYTQEREQWHSGANFFAFAPGKVIGYERNINTIEELSNNGFEIITAKDFIEKEYIENDNNIAVVIKGSELSRGGGGCRCMTLPIKRI